MEKIKVQIDRSKWRFGGNDTSRTMRFGYTKLENSLGYMCCLGFIGKTLGHTVRDCAYPSGAVRKGGNIHQWPDLTIQVGYDMGSNTEDTNLVNLAVSINDDPDLSNESREERLINLFKMSSYDLEFVGEYPDDDG